MVPDGAVVTVSSSSGLGCPDAVLAALGHRFDETGAPRGLTTLHPIAAGDMWGIRIRSHRQHPDFFARVPGRILPERSPERRAAGHLAHDHGRRDSPAYNIPSGILYDMHREAAARRPACSPRSDSTPSSTPIARAVP